MFVTSSIPVLINGLAIFLTCLGFLASNCDSSYLSRFEKSASPDEMKYLFEMIQDREPKASSSSSSEEFTSSDTSLSSTQYKEKSRTAHVALPQPLPLKLPQLPPTTTTTTTHFQNENGNENEAVLEGNRKSLKLLAPDSDLDGGESESMSDYEDTSRESYLHDEPQPQHSSITGLQQTKSESSPSTHHYQSPSDSEGNENNENDIHPTFTSSLKLGPKTELSGTSISDGESGSESEAVDESENDAAGRKLQLVLPSSTSQRVKEGDFSSDPPPGESKGKDEIVVVRDQEEKLLLQKLMVGYERDVRPVRNASQPVLVRVGITLTQIFDMDEKQQVLTTNVWLDQEWNDELLRWDPKDFGGLEMIRIPCSRIWLPDIVLYNNADDYTRGYMPSRAMVSFDGNVFWPPPIKFRSTCSVDVTYFPFDDQVCSLKLGSWTYNGFQVDVTNRTVAVDLSNYVENGEWQLLKAVQQRNVVYYSCCPEFFPDVTITIVIRRKTLYYIYNIVLPCIMLSSLTLLVFCLPPDSGEKIALGITVLLAFSVFMLAINESLPETSESIPLIGVYLTIVMAITSVSVVMTVVVLNLHYLGPQVRPVPRWLMWLLPKEKGKHRIRQKSLLIPVAHREPKSGSLKRGHIFITQVRRAEGAETGEGYSIEVPEDKLEDMDIKGGGEMAGDPFRNEINSGNCSSNNARRRVTGDVTTASASTPASYFPGKISETPASYPGVGVGIVKEEDVMMGSKDAGVGGTRNVIFEELLVSIRTLINKQEEVEAQNNLVAEWRLVAQVVDRILFWCFFSFTFCSSALILVVLPLYKRSWYGSPLVVVNDTDVLTS